MKKKIRNSILMCVVFAMTGCGSLPLAASLLVASTTIYAANENNNNNEKHNFDITTIYNENENKK